MEDEKPQQSPPSQKINYAEPPNGVPSFYANNCAILPGVFDIKLFFGEMTGATPEAVTILQKAEVAMSWLQAKILAKFLQANIDAFEKKNGPIRFPMPPDPPEGGNPFVDQNLPMANVATPKVK